VPKPIAMDEQSHTAMYEFVEGTPITEVDSGAVDQAIQFLQDLNAYKLQSSAQALPVASEACFSVSAHLARTDARVRALVSIKAEGGVEFEARSFVQDVLVPVWGKLRAGTLAEWGEADELPQAERVLSPSDFGFHNALLRASGEICFLDFEYGGWDDIAKTVNDFFLHPAVPVPGMYFERFSSAVLEGFADPELQQRRITSLTPVLRVKWCCILLNDFLPVGDMRRQFAYGTADDPQRKTRQIEAAKKMLGNLTEEMMICT
jgi:hypothetical protein